MTTRFAASGLHAVSLTISVALLAAAPAFAQLVTQSPKPTGRNLEGVAFVSPTHGFVVGQNHHLLETFDGGLTWTTRMATALSTDPFYTIHFHDALHGYIGGNNQDAYRTTDGGATWTQMTSMLPGSVRSFDFITPTTGFVGYNGAIAWTPDGGDTWQARAVYPDAPIVYELSFADELVGVASGHRSTPHHDSGIYRTTDGGWTWTLVHDAGGPFVRLDAQSIICPTGIDVVRSDDGGQTWYFISPNGTPTSVSGLTRLGNSDVLIGVSFSGDIIRSPDLGVSWSHDVIGIGVLPALWACTAYDEQSAWVTGANGLTYRTTNAGQNWLLLNSGCGDEVTGIDFADDDFGVAVTHRGFVFRTENRGASWITSRLIETGIVFGREEGFRAVDVVNRDFVIAGGAGGILFRTDDGGESWTSVGWPHQPGFSGGFEIRAIRFTDPLNGWLGGFSDPSVFRSFDGGWSWTPVPEIGGAIVAIDAEGQRVWVSTAGNVVHRSFNDGQSWTSTTMPGNVYYLNDLEFADENNGWVVGWYGYMARSTNGGVSWTPFERSVDEVYFDIAMNGPTELLVTGYDRGNFRNFTLRSTNGGASWTRTDLNQFEESFTRAHVRPAGRYWLAGSFGKIVYSPAPALRITLPDDVPLQVAPRSATAFAVRVVAGEESVMPGSPTLWLRRAPGAAFEPIALEPVAGDDYRAWLPELACSDTPQFYLSAQGAGGTTIRLPANAPTGYYTTRIGVFEPAADLLSTDFENGLPAGWSATGLWHLTSSACLPAGSCGAGAWMYFGQDATCTFNTGGRAAGILRSPTFTLPVLQPGQTINVAFCSALDNEYPDNALGDDDQAILWWVSGTGQSPVNWFVDHATARTQAFNLNHLAGSTGRLEWRFDTMNTYMNDFRGWHIDNIRVSGPQLVCADRVRGDLDCNGLVNNFDIDPFVLAIADPAAYAATFPGCDLMNADIDDNGLVNNFDIEPFVQCLLQGACP